MKTGIIHLEKITDTELQIIHLIALRAGNSPSIDQITIEMDIACVHSRDGLRLSDLLTSNHFDFFHDIYGIAKNLNRKTGELENFFSPRFSL